MNGQIMARERDPAAGYTVSTDVQQCTTKRYATAPAWPTLARSDTRTRDSHLREPPPPSECELESKWRNKLPAPGRCSCTAHCCEISIRYRLIWAGGHRLADCAAYYTLSDHSFFFKQKTAYEIGQ